MEMKVDGNQIKLLRLKRSWSQEKLAEIAGLNPRTIQRAESEGSASLRTRLLLAEALEVQPEALDVPAVPPQELALPTAAESAPQGGWLAATRAMWANTSIYYAAVLAVVSLIYVASNPVFMSISRTNYSWLNLVFGSKELYQIVWWWAATVGTWALVSTPVLVWLFRKHKELFVPYLAAFCVSLGLVSLRGWRIDALAEVLSVLVYLSGLALLVSLYVGRCHTTKIRHAVFMCLHAYLVIWYCQPLAIGIMLPFFRYFRLNELGIAAEFQWDFLYSNALYAGLLLGKLVQLIPVALVLVLSIGTREQHTASGSGNRLFGFIRKNGNDSGEQPGSRRTALDSSNVLVRSLDSHIHAR